MPIFIIIGWIVFSATNLERLECEDVAFFLFWHIGFVVACLGRKVFKEIVADEPTAVASRV